MCAEGLSQEYIIKKYRIDELEDCLNVIEDDIGNKINNGNYSLYRNNR